METELLRSTVYFDGSCPLCRAEIGYYRGADRDGALCFIDVSQTDAAVPEGFTQRLAMERFHVRAGNGEILSGAAAFVEVWARLPGWRWAAAAATLPGATAALELGYRAFPSRTAFPLSFLREDTTALASRWIKARLTRHSNHRAISTRRVDLGSFPKSGVAVVFGAGGGSGAHWSKLCAPLTALSR